MNKPRTILEKRAAAFCADLARYGNAAITVEWRRSAAWGHNPAVTHNGEKLAGASGCGYCKESAALAECLRWLGATEDDRRLVSSAHGCGVETVIKRLAGIGWQMRRVASGKTFDAYELSRTPANGSCE